MSESDEIRNALSRFMNSFDLADWGAMADQLEPTIDVDYSDLRGEPPARVSAADYVRSRAEALRDLSTHHLLANTEIRVDGSSASVNASCMVWRSNGASRFDSHAFYRFALVKRGVRWKIAAIAQKIFWSDGDPGLHRSAAGGKRSP